jgi:Flp pilus assembly protein TadG
MSMSHKVHQGEFIMIIKASEKGQALILITLAAIGLFAFAALAIDSSMAYSNKRHAQNAADTAALAGALSYARQGNTTNVETVALARAESNGYENETEGAPTVVTVTVADVPEEDEDEYCPGDATGKDITVTIESYVNATFSKIIGRNLLASGATATARACGQKLVPLFNGDAIVTLNSSKDPKNCPFDSGQSNSAHWKIKGSGIFSNGCAHAKDSDAVTFDPGRCVTSVGTASGFGCTGKTATPKKYPDDVLKIMPPNPCVAGGIGITPSSGQTEFKNGVYCITNMDAFDKKDVRLENATLYVLDLKFDLKFAGDGGFYGTPTRNGGYAGSEPYSNYYMIIAMNSSPCTEFNKGDQVIEWRGNGSGSFYGTILAPSSCLDLRGNGDADGMHTQIIAYTVSSNGNAGGKDEVYVNYKQDENHEILVSPSVSILE